MIKAHSHPTNTQSHQKSWKRCEIFSKIISLERYSGDFVIKIEILPEWKILNQS